MGGYPSSRGLGLDQGSGQGDPLGWMSREPRPSPASSACLGRARRMGTQCCSLPSRGIPTTPPRPTPGRFI